MLTFRAAEQKVKLVSAALRFSFTTYAYPHFSFSLSHVCDVSLGEDLVRTRLHLTVFRGSKRGKMKWREDRSKEGEGIKNASIICKNKGMEVNWYLLNSLCICAHERSAEVLRLMTSII